MTSDTVTRRVAAIVIADVVGYTRMMERDDTGTFSRLGSIRNEVTDPAIVSHGGHIVQTAGDGWLAEFPSALAALRASTQIQREMAKRNATQSPDELIEYRIGVNLGDIMVQGTEIAGDGVNVASRLETLAEPGGICISTAVREQVHGQLDADFVDAGEHKVKNIERPIRVFRVRLDGVARASPKADARMGSFSRIRHASRISVAVGAIVTVIITAAVVWQRLPGRDTVTRAAISGPPPRSIMVLPFSSPAGDAVLGPLASSLSANVTPALANSVRDARVVAPTAGKSDSTIDVRALGRDANVRYLIGGEVHVAGDDIVASVRLLDATTGTQLDSERRSIARTRATDDDELLIARVTAAARLMFNNAEGRRVAAEPVDATDAHSLVSRADAIFTGEDLASTRAARKLYEQAIERNPSLITAWIGHLETLDDEHWSDLSAGRNERLLAEMDRDSRRAIQLDDRDPRAWRAREEALADQWQWQAAFEANDRARSLDPSRFWTGAALYILSGRSSEALEEIAKRNAMVGTPDSKLAFTACHAHVHLGQYERAVTECGRAVADDNFYWVYLDLIVAYAQTGDMVRARAAKGELMKRVPDFTISRLEAKQFSNHPVWIEEIRTRFIPGLRKAGVPE